MCFTSSFQFFSRLAAVFAEEVGAFRFVCFQWPHLAACPAIITSFALTAPHLWRLAVQRFHCDPPSAASMQQASSPPSSVFAFTSAPSAINSFGRLTIFPLVSATYSDWDANPPYACRLLHSHLGAACHLPSDKLNSCQSRQLSECMMSGTNGLLVGSRHVNYQSLPGCLVKLDFLLDSSRKMRSLPSSLSHTNKSNRRISTSANFASFLIPCWDPINVPSDLHLTTE